MNRINFNAVVLALGLLFSAGVIADSAGISRDDYRAGKNMIEVDYKAAMTGCDSLSGNANDICKVEAKGKEKVALAELEARYKPTLEARYEVQVAKAEADHAVAKERCNDLAGNAKDVCVKEAEAAEVAAKADAKAQLETSDANAAARDKIVDARDEAGKQAAEADKDAAADKREAEYAVAKEKCGAFAGSAKAECLVQAKVSFDRPE